MNEFFTSLTGSQGFMPHGHCYLWTPGLLWTYVVSDAAIGLAYYAIPAGIAYFMRKRSDLQFNWRYTLFAIFIFACGTTHFLGVWTIWNPDYYLDASVRALTAIASGVTAVLLWPLIPKALQLPNTTRLQQAVRQLEHEVEERRGAEAKLEALRATLEHRVEERTRALMDINRKLKSEIESRKAAEESLRNEKRRIEVTLSSIADGVISTDTRAAVTYLNPVAERLTGWTLEEAGGRPVQEVFAVYDEATGQPALSRVELALSGRNVARLPTASQTLLRHRAGVDFAIEDAAAPLLDEEGRIHGAVLVFHDISEARKNAVQMAYLATHDSLTGLPNRAFLGDRLAEALSLAQREGHRVALMFIDVDNFKTINDSLGHHVGDRLLVEIADRLRSAVRGSDTVSRQGGDEFVILLHQVADRLAPADVARKLLESLRGIQGIGNDEVRVSGSIGIALYPDDGEDADVLTRNADSAMYHAKALGRNNFQFFTKALNDSAAERLRLENSLRRAVEQNEFELHYQPKIALHDGRIIGAEVLVRWRHPTRGLVSPGHFIAAAEQSGLIKPIGSWVLREACTQTRAWQRAGIPPVPMAVNLSAMQLHGEGFLEEVTSVLQETDLPPHLLEFEVTESVSIHGEEKAVNWLETLKGMGVKLSIDDFGTGYSSLSYLKRLPIDSIKIDQSFIRDITTDPDDAAIITAIIRMAHSLRLNVIAEGVENADQLDFLRRQNCNQVQGHFFSRPVPADEFERLLREQPQAA